MVLTATTIKENAPGIEIKYETSAVGADPTVAIESAEGDGDIIAADDVFTVTTNSANYDNASVLFEVTGIDKVNKTVTGKIRS